MTVMYLLIEVTRNWPEEFVATRLALGMYSSRTKSDRADDCRFFEAKFTGLSPCNSYQTAMG